ncbi:MAG: hypothetical protein ACOYMG_10490 [Candidatus Methylumidiphilus sp.]
MTIKVGALVLINVPHHQPKAQNGQNIYHQQVVSLNFEDDVEEIG